MLSIYKASAGSGKTFTLTYRYLRLLLGERNPETGKLRLTRNASRNRHARILAITFTNMATDEMKRRILHELALLGGMEADKTAKSDHEATLCRDLSTTPAELSKAARTALLAMLNNYRDFNVSTIDAFFQVVLRTFAREAELTGDFELELDKDYSIIFGINRLIEQAADDIDTGDEDASGDEWSITPRKRAILRGRLIAMMEDAFEQGNDFLVTNRQKGLFARLQDFIKKATDETFNEHKDEILAWLSNENALERFRQALNEAREKDRKVASGKARNMQAMIEEIGTENINANFFKAIAKISALKPNEPLPDRGKTIPNVYSDTDKAINTSLRKKIERGAFDAGPLFAAISDTCEVILKLYEKASLIKLLSDNIYSLALLEGVMSNVDMYRADTSTVYINDTNSMLRKIIGDDDTPFIYERTGMYLRHFLIDEFQDTSPMQWANLRALVTEGVSCGDESLVIGDEKQSIYRFRDSDPDLLHSLHTDPGLAPFVDPDSLSQDKADTNWRSASHIVGFNNTLFSTMAGSNAIDLGGYYDGARQEVAPKHEAHNGFICMNPIEAGKQETAFEIIYCHMLRQLSSGGYLPSDIAVLTRKREIASAFINWFNHRVARETRPAMKSILKDVRLMSDEALLIGNSGAVKMILSFLRYIANTSAEESEENLLNDTKRIIAGVQHRVECLIDEGTTADEAMRIAIEELHTTPLELSRKALSIDSITLPAIVERICSSLIPESLRCKEAVYVTAFHDLVIDFCSTGPASPADFLRWWKVSGKNKCISGAADKRAIRVLTIHRSKGLEFKCVHLPLLSSKDESANDCWMPCREAASLLGIDPDVAPPLIFIKPTSALGIEPFAEMAAKVRRDMDIDTANLLYVAFTRAQCELTCCFPKTVSKRPSLAGAFLDNMPLAFPGRFSVDSPFVEGRPTHKADFESPGQEAPRSFLDPTEPERPMPDYSDKRSLDIWSMVDLERDEILTTDADLCRRALQASTNLEVIGRQLPPSRRDALLPIIEQRISDKPEWFGRSRRTLTRHNLYDSSGRYYPTDRIVTAMNGDVHVISYRQRPELVPDEEQIEALSIRVSIMRRLSPKATTVKGHLYDILSGIDIPVK